MRQVIGALLAAILCLGGFPALAGEMPPPALSRGLSVLVISSFHQDLPFAARIENGLNQALQYRDGRNAVYFEYLDGSRFDLTQYGGLLAQTLAAKYRQKNVDAVIAWGGAAARFVAAHWDTLQPRHVIGGELSPVTLKALRDRAPDAVSVQSEENYQAALTVAVQTGQARRVTLVGESMGDSGKARLTDLLAGWRYPPDEVTLENLFDQPLDRVVERARTLPPDSIIYYTPIFHSETGGSIRPVDALARIAAAAAVPIYSQWDTFIGPQGGVGGYALSGEILGRTAGQLAVAAIQGDRDAVATLARVSPYETIFDAGQMARWNVAANRLPAGTKIINRPPALWEQHRDFILAVIGALAGMAAFSLILLRVLASRQRLLRELAAERQQLAEKVAERTVDLETKAGELARSNDELESFAYAISHDLRAPLRTIRSYIALLMEDLGDRLNDDEKECAGFIRSSGDRLDGMIHGLLEYSRVGRREEEAHSPMQLQQAVAEAMDALDLAHQNPDAVVALTIAADTPLVRLDPQNASRLVQNLLDNALKYRHPDRPVLIEVALYRKDDEVVLAVRDNGVGIAANQQERIFGLFQRVATDRPGYGVGLALCRRIVETGGGRMWVESRPGEGSAFFAAFPVQG